MSALLATLSRELGAYFYSPFAYLLLAAQCVASGIVFMLMLGYLNNAPSPPGTPLQAFFGVVMLFVLPFLGAVVPMRLLAEERRSGTVELLMTAPVSETQVVLGKYLAALLLFVFLWLPSLVYAVILDSHAGLDWGPVAASYAGILGIGAMFLAAGLLASALTRNPVVAAMSGFVLVLVLLFAGFVQFLADEESVREAGAYVNLTLHMEEFGLGIVDTRRFVYYATMTVLFLVLSIRAFAARKWR